MLSKAASSVAYGQNSRSPHAALVRLAVGRPCGKLQAIAGRLAFLGKYQTLFVDPVLFISECFPVSPFDPIQIDCIIGSTRDAPARRI